MFENFDARDKMRKLSNVNSKFRLNCNLISSWRKRVEQSCNLFYFAPWTICNVTIAQRNR